ncbi:MAG: HPr family phosphocarrier protein [Acutalibacteraceae bacterium]|nr:HPr family phosphocarrier protein [Bacillota bacterium]
MIKRSIKFSSVNEIKDFVNLTMSQGFDIDLMAGRYVVDAKSILAVFGLDLDSEVTIGIHATEEEAADFLTKVSKYLA